MLCTTHGGTAAFQQSQKPTRLRPTFLFLVFDIPPLQNHNSLPFVRSVCAAKNTYFVAHKTFSLSNQFAFCVYPSALTRPPNGQVPHFHSQHEQVRKRDPLFGLKQTSSAIYFVFKKPFSIIIHGHSADRSPISSIPIIIARILHMFFAFRTLSILTYSFSLLSPSPTPSTILSSLAFAELMHAYRHKAKHQPPTPITSPLNHRIKGTHKVDNHSSYKMLSMELMPMIMR